MQYVLTFLFIGFSYIVNWVIGREINNEILHREDIFCLNFVVGWLFFNTIEWGIGLVCQLALTSWKIYFISNVFILSVTILFIFVKYFKKNHLKLDFDHLFSAIVSHIKKYWFVYLMVGVFSTLSITNMQPFTVNNYSDDHYIVKIVHLINSPVLLNETYSTGNVAKLSGIKSLLNLQGHRVINTYELTYGFISTVFHINPVFFCRFVITIFNYFIVFLIIMLFSSQFVGEELAQFSLMYFTFLLIPSGFAAKGNALIKIRMFENWRFQTAIYMGGSIVRITAIPISLFNLLVYLENKKSGLVLSALIISTYLSFQTTFVSYVFLCLFVAEIVSVILAVVRKRNITKDTIISLGLFMAIVFCIAISSKVGKVLNINTQEIYTKYLPYNKDSFTYDFFAKYSLIPAAAFLPSPIARITVAAPRTMSPPAHTLAW